MDWDPAVERQYCKCRGVVSGFPHRVEQGETYGKPKFASYLRRDELAQWAVQLVDTDGSKENWDWDMMSK